MLLMGKSTISTGPFSIAFCMFTRPGKEFFLATRFGFISRPNAPTTVSCYPNWLVVFRHPSEKSWSSSVGMMKFPYINIIYAYIYIYMESHQIPWFQSPPISLHVASTSSSFFRLKPVEVGVAIHVVVRCMDIFHLKSVNPAGSTPE